MKITKLVHSCLMVEMPDRTAIFDPGVFSEEAINQAMLEYLDDIIITHEHSDHMSVPLIHKLVNSFPGVRISAAPDAAEILNSEGVATTPIGAVEGVAVFESPHESVEPMFPLPNQSGFHYLDKLTHPGDSHSFLETKDILALPVTAPWGSSIRAVNLGLELKPKWILPIHDWHWNDQARAQMYESFDQIFSGAGIKFLKLQDNKPVVLETQG